MIVKKIDKAGKPYKNMVALSRGQVVNLWINLNKCSRQ
ncbi:MAG: hypothetical protein A4E56_02847 [Pelotomaculum sp. PtaU1.Bin065]|nr:MAG: hypothetical protein A4E56_02847 [Pelotomaculum sp. PtaU1.Bin065]